MINGNFKLSFVNFQITKLLKIFDAVKVDSDFIVTETQKIIKFIIMIFCNLNVFNIF